MTNVVRDASAEGRSATCRIDDLKRPRIELLPNNTIPVPNGEISQVVIRFDERGHGDLPIFLTGPQPKIKLGIEYETVDRDENDRGALLRDFNDAQSVLPEDAEAPPTPEYCAPRHLTLEANIKVPSRILYRNDIERILKWFLIHNDLFDETTSPDLKISDPASSKLLNRFVYRVNYRLSKETMARVERQLRLIEDT